MNTKHIFNALPALYFFFTIALAAQNIGSQMQIESQSTDVVENTIGQDLTITHNEDGTFTATCTNGKVEDFFDESDLPSNDNFCG